MGDGHGILGTIFIPFSYRGISNDSRIAVVNHYKAKRNISHISDRFSGYRGNLKANHFIFAKIGPQINPIIVRASYMFLKLNWYNNPRINFDPSVAISSPVGCNFISGECRSGTQTSKSQRKSDMEKVGL